MPWWLLVLSYAVILIIILILIFNIILRRKLKNQAKIIQKAERQQYHNDRINALGHMAGGIAHDFNNSLTGIMGFSELIRDQVDSEEIKSYVQHIIDSSQRATELAQQLLSFARKESTPRETTDIHTILEAVYSILKHTINPKILLTKKLESGNPVISCYASQLQSALLNLCLNGVDAMDQGGMLFIGTRDVTLTKRDVNYLECCHVKSDVKFKPGKFLEITIEDSGTGIDKENLDKVFEPYFTTKERGKGTGLGLSAVIGTVSLHEGILLLQTEQGEGTKFAILLPLQTLALEQPEPRN